MAEQQYYRSEEYNNAVDQIAQIARLDRGSAPLDTDLGASMLSSLNRLYKFDSHVDTTSLESVTGALQRSFRYPDYKVDGQFGPETAQLVMRDTAVEPFRNYDLLYDRDYKVKIDEANKYLRTHEGDFLESLHTLYPEETAKAKTLTEAVRAVQKARGEDPADGIMGPGFANDTIKEKSPRMSAEHNDPGKGYINFSATHDRNNGLGAEAQGDKFLKHVQQSGETPAPAVRGDESPAQQRGLEEAIDGLCKAGVFSAEQCSSAPVPHIKPKAGVHRG